MFQCKTKNIIVLYWFRFLWRFKYIECEHKYDYTLDVCVLVCIFVGRISVARNNWNRSDKYNYSTLTVVAFSMSQVNLFDGNCVCLACVSKSIIFVIRNLIPVKTYLLQLINYSMKSANRFGKRDGIIVSNDDFVE